MSEVAEIYNSLLKFESSSREEAYPIHKKISFTDGSKDIPDWIMHNNLCPVGASVLDVGCGTGNTLFKLAKFKQASGLGISISEKEIKFANDQLEKLDNDVSIAFKKQSFDDPIIYEKFDVIIAIESLKHSSNLSKTIKNLLKVSHENTMFIIADDFLIHASVDSHRQKVLWNAPSLFSVSKFEELLKNEGFAHIKPHIFTDKVHLKPKFLLKILIFTTGKLKKLVSANTKILLETYLGALILEKLYQRKEMDYCILVANCIND